MRRDFRTVFLFTLPIVIVALFIACGSSTKLGKVSTPTTPWPTSTKSPPATTPTITPTPGPPQTFSVTIGDREIVPMVIYAKVGDTLVWTNSGPSIHRILADHGSFDSGNLSPGQTFSHTFLELGTYTYHCEVSSWLTGVVYVQ